MPREEKKSRFSQQALNDLLELKKKIDKELRIFFQKEKKRAKKIDRTANQALEIVEEFTLRGGKRLRPALTYFGYQCFSGDFYEKELLQVSMVNELLQSGLLIHDDIMDQSVLRRHKPTVHLIFEQAAKTDFGWSKNFPHQRHFGLSMAICAGDLCFALMNRLILESNFKNKEKALLQLERTFQEVVYGQIIDGRSGFEKNISLADVLKIYRLKSATYTIEAPLTIGALLAGANQKQIADIQKFAFPLGIAFQIQDDILDLFGDSEKTGKEEGKDLKEGKRTLLILKTLEKASGSEKRKIESGLGKNDLSKEEIGIIKEIIKKSGALDYCRDYSRKLILQAQKNIQKQNYLPKGRDFLLGIVTYLLEREA